MERKDIFDIGIENRKYVSKMRVKLGRDIETYRVVNYDLNRFRGLAIYDERNNRKNILLNKIVTELDKNNEKDDLQFVLIGSTDLSKFLCKEKLIKTFSITKNAMDIVDYLASILNKRKKIFKSLGVNSLYRYNEICKEKLPSILVVVDDYDELDKGARMLFDDFVMTASYLFRGCGFSFIFTTKDFYAISSTINSILTHQIVFKPKESFKLRRLLNGAYPKIDYGNIFYFTSDYEDTKTVDMSEILDISNQEVIEIDDVLPNDDKQKAIDICIALGKEFICVFEMWYDDKVHYKKCDSTEENHNIEMCLKMKKLYEDAKTNCSRTLGRQVLNSEMWDWFFSAGGDFRDFLNCPTNDKVLFYDNLATQILSGKSLKNTLALGLSEKTKKI